MDNEVEYITDDHVQLSKCIKEAALCKLLSKRICLTHCINDKYSQNLISINLNCNKNERVSVFGGNFILFMGKEMTIRQKGMYGKCEHKHCMYSFCCMNDHPEQTKKYVQNLSSDNVLLLMWTQHCEQKQKCTIPVPRGDMRITGRNYVKLDYKNDCKFSSFYRGLAGCYAFRMNIQYHCLPADYSELDSVKGKQFSCVLLERERERETILLKCHMHYKS